jgi:3-hydroxy-9,10-secoandrosta-1,3,5(10)-triene-9,17-dione monooxygenase
MRGDGKEGEMTTSALKVNRTDSAGFNDDIAEEMVGRAREIAKIIKRDARQSDRDRRMSDENYSALEDAGLLDLVCPKRDGGYGTSLTTFARCVHEIAKASGSAGWLYALSGSGSWNASKFPQKLHDEYFSGPKIARQCGSVALNGTIQKVDGGYLLNGRWPYCTGAWHAQWGGGGVWLLKEDGSKVPGGMVMTRMENLKRVDDWYPTGMRGTGSISLEAKNALIPEHHLIPGGKDFGASDNPGPDPSDYWDFRNALVTQNAQASIGAAEGILERARTILSGKRCLPFTVFEPENAFIRMGSTEIAQHQFARSAALIYSARLILMRGMGELDAFALERKPMPLDRQAFLRTEQSLINEMVREAVDKLITVLGNSALSEADDIDIGWRDIGVITRHANVATNIGYQAFGKVMLDPEGAA